MSDLGLDDEPRAGGRRRRKRPQRLPGCLAVLVALAVVVGGLYFARRPRASTRSRTSSPTPRTTPGPGTGEVVFEVERGRHRRRDRPQPEGRRASSRRVDAFIDAARAEPGGHRHPGRLLPAAEGDGGRRRARRPGRPGRTSSRTPSRSPRGCGSTTSSTSLAKKTDFAEAAVREGARRPRRSSGCPTTPRATRRATCSRRPTTSGPNADAASILHGDGRPLGAGGRGRRPRGARPRSSATRPHELMTVASLVEAEAPRRGHAARSPG